MIGTKMIQSDDDFEDYSEKVRTYEDRRLTTELSKLYHDLKAMNEDDKITPEDDERKEKITNELEGTKRRIGVLEQEIGRRKKDGSWAW
jgi:hypothetical protein